MSKIEVITVKVMFYVLAVASIMLTIGIGRMLGTQGDLKVAIIPIILSPIMMVLVRQVWEHGKPDGLLDPRTQSWAFLFGDTIMLPLALGAAAYSWRSLPAEGWHRSIWWFVTSVAAGVVISVIFHFVLNAPNYEKAGNGAMMGSPTSIWHDVVVYLSLATLLVFLGIPAVLMDFTGTGWLVVVGVVGWGVCGALDATIHPLEQTNLHPKKQDTLLA